MGVNQTVGRWPDQKYVEPMATKAGATINTQYYSGQLIVQDKTLNGAFRPYVLGLTGSVVVGVNKMEDFNVTAAVPLPQGMLEVAQGTFAFQNDPATSGSFSQATLVNTLAWGAGDQTASTIAGPGYLPIGRFRVFDPLNTTYPVFVETGFIASGTLA